MGFSGDCSPVDGLPSAGLDMVRRPSLRKVDKSPRDDSGCLNMRRKPKASSQPVAVNRVSEGGALVEVSAQVAFVQMHVAHDHRVGRVAEDAA